MKIPTYKKHKCNFLKQLFVLYFLQQNTNFHNLTQNKSNMPVLTFPNSFKEQNNKKNNYTLRNYE
jgi:hypothetical protein